MKMTVRAAVGLLLVILPFTAMGAARADTTVNWTGNGSENLPCADAAHWVLSPAKGITSATLFVDGVPFTMTQNGKNGSFATDSGPVYLDSIVTASYEGNNTTAFLKLSHCEEGAPPPPPPA